ncbi:MAG: VWA domain-containing protein [Verrucomicrobiae bacterium]|nr:VWA domain-containing protein [Verrucomicrobiae bacterium]
MAEATLKFAEPYWLLLLPVVLPAAVWLWRWAAARRRALLSRVMAPRLQQQFLQAVNYTRRRQKLVFLLGGLTLLIIALARPMLGNREVRVELPGIDYFIALDISRSMLAEDAAGTNRLTAAKRALTQLLRLPSGDRVGLIAFAGEAFLISPISQDHGAIERSLLALTTTSVSKPGTDIAAAIELALKSFEAKQEAGKAILIVSDGEELQGDAILAARQAAQQKVAIFTLGVGSAAGARIPDRTWGQPLRFAKTEFGREVVSRMNERVLQQVAAAGRGAYARLEDQQGKALLELYEQHLKRLPKGTHVRKSTDPQDIYQIPLALGLLLLLIEGLLNERRRVT